MKIYDIEVSTHGELRGDGGGEAVGGEVEYREVDEVLEVGGDGTSQRV